MPRATKKAALKKAALKKVAPRKTAPKKTATRAGRPTPKKTTPKKATPKKFGARAGMLDLGADPNGTAPTRHDKSLEDPLVFLAIDSSWDAAGEVAALIKAGARVDGMDAQGLTPMLRAVVKTDEAAAADVMALLPTLPH